MSISLLNPLRGEEEGREGGGGDSNYYLHRDFSLLEILKLDFFGSFARFHFIYFETHLRKCE